MPTPPVLPAEAPLPVYSEPPITGMQGTFSPAWYKWFTVLNTLARQLKANFPGLIVVEDVDVIEEFIGEFVFPIDGAPAAVVILEAKVARTINEITTQCDAGTATLTGKINGTALGGGPNAVSATKQTKTHATQNAIAIGDKLTLDLSSTSSDCANLSWIIKTTRKITMLQYA
jgi:hypothetical protein